MSLGNKDFEVMIKETINADIENQEVCTLIFRMLRQNPEERYSLTDAKNKLNGIAFPSVFSSNTKSMRRF